MIMKEEKTQQLQEDNSILRSTLNAINERGSCEIVTQEPINIEEEGKQELVEEKEDTVMRADSEIKRKVLAVKRDNAILKKNCRMLERKMIMKEEINQQLQEDNAILWSSLNAINEQNSSEMKQKIKNDDEIYKLSGKINLLEKELLEKEDDIKMERSLSIQ